MGSSDMAQSVLETERAWQALGQVSYGATEAEKKSIVFRRSLYVVKNLRGREVLTKDNVCAIRPRLGLPPKYLEEVLGRTLNQDASRGTALNWGLIR